jgi:2,4-dienoyl-CoA reductase-like NADH-dependent reductase (Old Yellow Enzyme family)
LRVVEAVRGVWPVHKPLQVRLSCSDWHPAGLTIADIVPVAHLLRQHGADALDCSSAGLTLAPPASIGPGYQVAFAEQLRRVVGLPTIALGLITAPAQAEHILMTGQADMIALGRVLLREPYWPLHAARALGADVEWPKAYQRAKL